MKNGVSHSVFSLRSLHQIFYETALNPQPRATSATGGSSCISLDDMTFLRYFIYIVGGALASSAIGGIFACVVALVSPAFVGSLFARDAAGSLVRYAARRRHDLGRFPRHCRHGVFSLAGHADSHCSRHQKEKRRPGRSLNATPTSNQSMRLTAGSSAINFWDD